MTYSRSEKRPIVEFLNVGNGLVRFKKEGVRVRVRARVWVRVRVRVRVKVMVRFR